MAGMSAPPPPSQTSPRGSHPRTAGPEGPTRRDRMAATGTRAAMSLVRLIALVGVVGLAVLVGAIMDNQGAAGWIEGLVTGTGAVTLTSVVFLSRRLGRRT